MRVGGSRVHRIAVTLAVCAVALTLLPVASAGASSYNDRYGELQQKIDSTQAKIRAAKAKEKGIIAQISASDSRRLQLERVISSLNDELSAATAHLNQLNATLGQVQLELDQMTRNLEQTTGALQDQQELYEQRAAQGYMDGPGSFLDVVLNTEDFHDFIAGNEYLTSVLRSDIGTLRDIEDLKGQIEARRAAIASRKAALQEQFNAVLQQQQRIAGLRRQQASARSAVVHEINYRKQLLAKAQNERAAYEQALQSYIDESNTIEALIRAAQSGQGTVGAHHGYLKWPVHGEITSPYGWRTHPIYHDRSFHTGIDIAAPQGTNVGAARSGKILFVGQKGAYGLMVIIDHGYSLATAYAHLSKVYVREGEVVKTLETIAAVGTTGWSTGPHLHFEVRVNGETQDPMLWL